MTISRAGPTPEERRALYGMNGEDSAYVMYTSVSTGRAKGTEVLHRNVIRLVCGTTYADLGSGQTVPQFSPLSFDASTFEIWGPLLNGGCLAICPPHLPTLSQLGEVIRRHGVTTVWLTVGLFAQMVEHDVQSLASLQQLLTGGDVMSVPHAQRLLAAVPRGPYLLGGFCLRLPLSARRQLDLYLVALWATGRLKRRTIPRLSDRTRVPAWRSALWPVLRGRLDGLSDVVELAWLYRWGSRHYRPGYYAGTVTLFVGEDDGLPALWRDRTKELDVRIVPGDHDSFVEHLQTIAATLQPYLDRHRFEEHVPGQP
jgi:acyl-CoA synthetase (AMP-forming)/AMP-acid ligase II